MMPLLTMLSITGVAAARAEAASSCLPALSARVALRMALRSCEVSASLRARCTVDCRAAFSADFVFAKRRLLHWTRGPIRTPKEPRSLPIGQALVNCHARESPSTAPWVSCGACYSGSLDIGKPEYNHGLSPWN